MTQTQKAGRPKQPERYIQIGVFIPASLYPKLRETAYKQGLTVSSYVRTLIIKALEGGEK